MTINLYVKKEYQKYLDELKVCADANGRTLSSQICKAVKFFRLAEEGKIDLTDKEIWDQFFKKANKEELLKMSTFICDINTKIIRKCQE